MHNGGCDISLQGTGINWQAWQRDLMPSTKVSQLGSCMVLCHLTSSIPVGTVLEASLDKGKMIGTHLMQQG